MLDQRIKEARKEKQITQEQLADCVGVTKSAVSQWEGGDTKGMKPENIFKAAECLGVSPKWLATGEGSKYQIREAAAVYLQGGKSVPIISWVQAGNWCESVVDHVPDNTEYLNCPVPCSNSTFALKVQGVSMEPEVKDGEIIFVDPEELPKHGDLVVARIDSTGEATFKKLIIEGKKMLLKAINPDWPDKILPVTSDATICGVVIFHGRSRR